jgi:hypothetical protein
LAEAALEVPRAALYKRVNKGELSISSAYCGSEDSIVRRLKG